MTRRVDARIQYRAFPEGNYRIREAEMLGACGLLCSRGGNRYEQFSFQSSGMLRYGFKSQFTSAAAQNRLSRSSLVHVILIISSQFA